MERRSPSILEAIYRQRCPNCRQGQLFNGLMSMHDNCPTCGLKFEREEGYYLGAMYFSYFLAVAVISILFVLGIVLLPNWSDILIATLALALFVPLVPFIFRMSRVLWIHFDRWAWPSSK